MQLKHIEHPEDTILTGDLSVLNWFTTQGKLSLKIDGCPAIVWGTDPECGQFFVGTKSVFNKRKKMICHSHDEIDMLYADKDELADKLHYCLDALPHTERIYQGDLIGLGGDDLYQPNTIGYLFPDIITHDVIVAPHTEYIATKEGGLPNAIAKPLLRKLQSDDDECLFIQPSAWVTGRENFVRTNIFEQVRTKVQFAKQMAQLVTFVDEKQASVIRQMLNGCIRLNLKYK